MILLGIVDFCCILIGLEQVSVNKIAGGTIWISAGVGSGLIGYYWHQIKQRVGRRLVKVGHRLQNKREVATEDGAAADKTAVDGILAGLPKQVAPIEGVSVREWRDGFRNPRFEIVDDHRFENEEIIVDNKSFRRCSFKNVKLLFHGRAPFEFVEGTTLDAGTVIFATDDPAILTFNAIQRKFASLPGAQIQHGALDNKGKDVPSSPVTVVPVTNLARPLPYPIPSLRLRMLEAVSELQGFLGAHGEEPVVSYLEPGVDNAKLEHRRRTVLEPWQVKFMGDYCLQFGESIPRLRDEMRARAQIDDHDLNNDIEWAAKSRDRCCESVKNIASKLWVLGFKVNA
jgi:hypothetical protein